MPLWILVWPSQLSLFIYGTKALKTRFLVVNREVSPYYFFYILIKKYYLITFISDSGVSEYLLSFGFLTEFLTAAKRVETRATTPELGFLSSFLGSSPVVLSASSLPVVSSALSVSLLKLINYKNKFLLHFLTTGNCIYLPFFIHCPLGILVFLWLDWKLNVGFKSKSKNDQINGRK